MSFVRRQKNQLEESIKNKNIVKILELIPTMEKSDHERLLKYAIESESLEILKILLANGATISIPNMSTCYVISRCNVEMFKEIIKYIPSLASDKELLTYILMCGTVDILRLMILNGANLSAIRNPALSDDENIQRYFIAQGFWATCLCEMKYVSILDNRHEKYFNKTFYGHILWYNQKKYPNDYGKILKGYQERFNKIIKIIRSRRTLKPDNGEVLFIFVND